MLVFSVVLLLQHRGDWQGASQAQRRSSNIEKPSIEGICQSEAIFFSGTLRQKTDVGHPGLLLRHVGRHLLVIHARGVVTVRLSNEDAGGAKPDARPCVGLGESRITAAAFQQTRGGQGRYFSLTAAGELLTLGPHILTDCTVSIARRAAQIWSLAKDTLYTPVPGPMVSTHHQGFMKLQNSKFQGHKREFELLARYVALVKLIDVSRQHVVTDHSFRYRWPTAQRL